MFKNINKSSGQIAKTLLALAIVVLVALVIAYIVIKRAEKTPSPLADLPTEPKPVYEETIGDVRFVFLEATDKGGTLKGKDSRYPEWQKDLKTTERYIELIVGAQNVGKINTPEKIWDVGDIVDSEGRNYSALGDEVRSWIPQEDPCGSVLKPSFEPTPCKRIYEVAKVSTGLKVRVILFNEAYSKEGTEKVIDIQLMP